MRRLDVNRGTARRLTIFSYEEVEGLVLILVAALSRSRERDTDVAGDMRDSPQSSTPTRDEVKQLKHKSMQYIASSARQ